MPMCFTARPTDSDTLFPTSVCLNELIIALPPYLILTRAHRRDCDWHLLQVLLTPLSRDGNLVKCFDRLASCAGNACR